MHAKPPTHRTRIRQLILVLILDALLDDLPTAFAPRNQRRVELLINSSGRLPMPMPAVLLARPTTQPPLRLVGLPARERRRLTLPRPTRLLQLTLELRDPVTQPLILSRQTSRLHP
jgi:hypothetical protein